jgi:hypothetical protein
MILIRLSAFQGRLKSDIMEWPREEPNIYMHVSPSMPIGFDLGRNVIDFKVKSLRKARFENIGKSEVNNGRLVIVYELVEM